MADLRDQLLKAGLIDQRKKQVADTEARRKKKKKKSKKKRGAPDEETARRAAWEAQQEARAACNRQRDAARQAEQEARASQNRINNLVGAWAVRTGRPGRRRWCFVGRDRRIRWFEVGAEIAWHLEQGSLAIVERPGHTDEPYALVPRRIAERIQRIDATYVRFWNETPAEKTGD